MKVAELIAVLQQCDPEANVLMVTQPSWPFEWSIAGVAVRDPYGDEEFEPGVNLQPWYDEPAGNDVFLLEGSQLRYGSGDPWNQKIS